MGTFRFIGTAALVAKGQAALLEAVTDTAEDFVGKAQAETPVDTGTLKAGIHVDSVVASGMEVTATVATGGESDDYSLWVHEGTSKMAPRKYMERPLIEQRPVYLEHIARAARKQF